VADPSPSTSSSASPAPTATEIIHRPDPGLARGKWEAPTWAFWVMGAVALLFALGYLGIRIGMFASKKR
jgi:hypothetical protein